MFPKNVVLLSFYPCPFPPPTLLRFDSPLYKVPISPFSPGPFTHFIDQSFDMWADPLLDCQMPLEVSARPHLTFLKQPFRYRFAFLELVSLHTSWFSLEATLCPPAPLWPPFYTAYTPFRVLDLFLSYLFFGTPKTCLLKAPPTLSPTRHLAI